MANVTSDVRSSIPFTDLTNPSKFKSYEHQEYPKMMLQKNGKPFMGPDDRPILVCDEDEEAEFRNENETLVIVNDRQLNAAERSELEELRALKDQLSDKSGGKAEPGNVEDDKPNRLAGLTTPVRQTAQPARKGQQLKDKTGARLPAPIKSK